MSDTQQGDRYIACGLYQNGNTNASVWTSPFTHILTPNSESLGDVAQHRCALANGGSPVAGFDKILVYLAPETPILVIDK